MEYSSYWRGWMKSNQIFYFCFAAPSLLARLRYGHKMVGSCREILLQKISKVQSGWTSGMICSHNGKIGLVGNVRIATGRRRRGRSRNKRQRPNWRLPILKRCYPLWPKMHKKTLLNQWNQTSMPRNERKEDAFLSPAVETYAYRYVTLPYSSVGGRRKWCCSW